MAMKVHYLNPGGNITAVVRGADPCERLEISKEILASGAAEQVAFETVPILTAESICLGRIEMMGGEFCGNATRAYGYLRASEMYHSGCHKVLIEISGLSAPVSVEVDLDRGTAYTDMPVPSEVSTITVNGSEYPVVKTEGIDHLIAWGQVADEAWGRDALEAMKGRWNTEAMGIMFLDETELTPLVWVRATDSLVWESSCGSGSVACGWYQGMNNPEADTFLLKQPGGEIQVRLRRDGEKITGCLMGGKVSI